MEVGQSTLALGSWHKKLLNLYGEDIVQLFGDNSHTLDILQNQGALCRRFALSTPVPHALPVTVTGRISASSPSMP